MGKSSGNGKLFFGAVVGGLVGAAAAMLLTPKTGRQMRKEILESLDDARETLRDRSGEMGRFAGNLKEAATEKWIDIRDTATESLKKSKGEGSGAAEVKSGKEWVEIGTKSDPASSD
ncbi:YtxH domain-containing protein [Kroppenstedtia eburnea]|uniref:Gas vesicle protein n=1 Tax=Kroppenstedtia eburnea TaxID=714067 RepID=A0A1N7NC71_9BACL|nr:YtxH domain-containing protein [Kroppenstedtia eburnea]QKI83082.1 YtxH domain-containing protein [Kroppenstedtia eburnea]SIS95916.1 Gas vesicle protein [Kroppenstedtia eburnea]